jgi:hypothetical protein
MLFVAGAEPAMAQWRGHGGYRGGGGFGGAVLGGVIGGVIGSAMTRPRYQPQYQPEPVYQDPMDYCIQRFRSFNPETGFYLGFDGIYRRCP